MFKIIKVFLPFLFLLFFLLPARAADSINLYFFYGDGCPHCGKEEEFLAKLENDHQNISIYSFEIYNNSENRRLFSEIIKKMDINTSGVPLLIVGEKHFVGYYNDKTTGQAIKKAVDDYLKYGCVDIAGPILGIKNQAPLNPDKDNQENECRTTEKMPEKISVPIFGEIDPRNFSLPVLTMVLAAIDGFNPCAMWVLLFLINLLLGMRSRVKMWTLGSAFIISSAAVYFLFLAMWLNIVLFMGLKSWLIILVALVAIFSGSVHLYDFWNKREGCKVTDNQKRKMVFEKLRKIVLEEKFYLALGSIIILAGLVNLVELLCSAGIPAVYVPILTLAGLPAWQYYLYLLFYILIFMLDDLIIFFAATRTLELKANNHKFTHYTGLVGGVIMVIIGILLLFKPGWLMFG